jgi:hypothetical protein
MTHECFEATSQRQLEERSMCQIPTFNNQTANHGALKTKYMRLVAYDRDDDYAGRMGYIVAGVWGACQSAWGN